MFPTYFLPEVSKDVSKHLNNFVHKYYPQINSRLFTKDKIQQSRGTGFKIRCELNFCLASVINIYATASMLFIFLRLHRSSSLVSPNTWVFQVELVLSLLLQFNLKQGKQINGDHLKKLTGV